MGVPEFDETVLERLEKLGGLPLARRMLDLFMEHTPQRIESARLGFQHGDLEAVSRAAHSLKSTAGHLCLPVLQELAGEIEKLAKAEQHASLSEKLHDLEAAFARVAPVLAQHRSTLGA
ncbi:MAG: Hpt domain-containing protein [Candidatus Tectimicrobiota bacterium]